MLCSNLGLSEASTTLSVMSDEYAALEDGLAALESINDESMIVFP